MKTDNNYLKYLKYKNKYFETKYLNINQSGGTINPESVERLEKLKSINDGDLDKIKSFVGLDGSSIFEIYRRIEMITFQTNIIKKPVQLKVIRIILDDRTENNRVLVVVPGISHNSFVNTAKRILTEDKLDQLKTKFSAIYLIEQESFKEIQDPVCDIRDLIIDMVGDEFKKDSRLNIEKFNQIYNPEAAFNDKIATFINVILRDKFKLSNVHLLGKSNGGWITTLLLEKDEIYKGLYLAVPGISSGVSTLNRIDPKRLRKINFIISWVHEDAFPFSFYGVSNKEKNKYDLQMDELQEKVGRLNYKSCIDTSGGVEDKKTQHEMYQGLIRYIVDSI